MDASLLENLLHQEESSGLDFKRDQYKFDKATDEEKGELLKDILAFANSWRQSAAHILIGVKEVRGGRSAVFGVTEHLLNRNLQQFVNSKTNRPVEFTYNPMTVEGQQIGVITIPVQPRPVFLTKSFGGLRANVVYIRRADTTAEANPDEVFRMGAASSEEAAPALAWEFGDLETRVCSGSSARLTGVVLGIPQKDSLPKYGKPTSTAFGLPISPFDSMTNREFYRDFADWLCAKLLLQPVGVVVHNQSRVAAVNAVLTLRFPSSGVFAVDGGSFPAEPSTMRVPALGGLGPQSSVTATRYGDHYEVRVELGTIPPGLSAWAEEPFFLGSRESMELAVAVTISAENVPEPIRQCGTLEILTEQRDADIAKIIELADGR